MAHNFDKTKDKIKSMSAESVYVGKVVRKKGPGGSRLLNVVTNRH